MSCLRGSNYLLVPLRNMFVEILEAIDLGTSNLPVIIEAMQCLEEPPAWMILIPFSKVAVYVLQKALSFFFLCT